MNYLTEEQKNAVIQSLASQAVTGGQKQVHGCTLETIENGNMKIIGVVFDDSGDFERITEPKKKEFEHLKTSYIVVKLARTEGIMVKPITKTIFENSVGEEFYDILYDAAQNHKNALVDDKEAKFEEIGPLPVSVYNMVTPQDFKFKGSDGREQVTDVKKIVIFKDIENERTVVRREMRRISEEDAWVGGETTQERIPDSNTEDKKDKRSERRSGT